MLVIACRADMSSGVDVYKPPPKALFAIATAGAFIIFEPQRCSALGGYTEEVFIEATVPGPPMSEGY